MLNNQENAINEYITGVTFILLRPSGEILMQLRDDGNGISIPYPDMWCFPGGGKDAGETYLSTTVREAREEYDMDINAGNFFLLTSYDHDNMINDHVYICPVPQHCSPKLREGRDMQWKKLAVIKELPLAWEQHKIIMILEEYLERL